MKLESIRDNLMKEAIFFSEDDILDQPTVIGYDKKFKWRWFATQLNTFIVATDLGDTQLTKTVMEQHLTHAFNYAQQNYRGWPRGLQSGIGVITILISSDIDEESKEYCRKLKSGKKWAGFSIPVAINSSTNEVHYFERNPVWGRIYYPYFKKWIERIC